SYQIRTTVFSRSGPEPSFWKNGESTAALAHTGSLRSPSTVTGPCSFGTTTRIGAGSDFGSGDLSAPLVARSARRHATTTRLLRQAGKHCRSGETARLTVLRMVRNVRGQFAMFPLTLTLSLREREQRAARGGKPRVLDCSPQREAFPLSPRERAGVRGNRPSPVVARISPPGAARTRSAIYVFEPFTISCLRF